MVYCKASYVLFVCLNQVYCIFLFLSAAFLFGILVSQINEIVAGQQAMSKELDSILDAYFSLQPR